MLSPRIQSAVINTVAIVVVTALLLSCAKNNKQPTETPTTGPTTTSDAELTCGEVELRTPVSVEKLICAAPGGHICTPDHGVCLEFPPNSLDINRRIKLSIAGPEFEVDGKTQLFTGARMEPHGLGFLLPVKAVVRPRGVDDLSNVSLLTASAPDQSEELDNVSRDPATGFVTGELMHFSWLYPYLVNAPPPAVLPSLSLHGGPGSPNYGAVGNGGSTNVGLAVVLQAGVLVWSSGGSFSETLVLQSSFPTAVAGQITHASITLSDPGPYTGVGPNARQQWRILVFNRIFGTLLGGTHPTGPDGIAIYPTRAGDIQWSQLPAGYPSATATAVLQFFDANQNLIGTSSLTLTISRPHL